VKFPEISDSYCTTLETILNFLFASSSREIHHVVLVAPTRDELQKETNIFARIGI